MKVLRRAVNVGEVASSAARDQNLPPRLRIVLQQQHAPPALPRNRSAHQPRRTRAQHDHVEFLRFRLTLPHCHRRRRAIRTSAHLSERLLRRLHLLVDRVHAIDGFCQTNLLVPAPHHWIASTFRPCFRRASDRCLVTEPRRQPLARCRCAEIRESAFQRFVMRPVPRVHIRHRHRLVRCQNRQPIRQHSMVCRVSSRSRCL